MSRLLTCQMADDCAKPVTHVDEKGFVYCTDHGVLRRSYCRCRKMRTGEIKSLERGDTISYAVRR